MSADNGYLVRERKNGKWVVQHYFMSAEEFPDINDWHLDEFPTAAAAEAFFSEAAKETEYGFRVMPYMHEGYEKSDRESTPEEDSMFFVDHIPLGFSESTLHKVYGAFAENHFLDTQQAMNIITSMQNAGILFRERVQ